MRLFNRKEQKEYTDQENIIPEVSPSKALEISREYLESLELEYQYSFGEPSICNLRCINLEEEDPKKRKTRPGEYQIPITIEDNDGTKISIALYLDSKTGELRKREFYTPKKDSLVKEMDERRQRYIVITTKNREDAERMSEEIFQNHVVKELCIYEHRPCYNIFTGHHIWDQVETPPLIQRIKK